MRNQTRPRDERVIQAAARAQVATWPSLTRDQVDRLRRLLGSQRDTENTYRGGDRS